MAELIEGVNPTRMELLKLKDKAKLAEKGHRLLKEKRDALVIEFFNILEEARGARKDVEGVMKEAFERLIMAEAIMGIIKTAEAGMAVREAPELGIEARNIMGVKVPVLRLDETRRRVPERGYSLMDTSVLLDEAAGKFEEALRAVVQLAEIEESIKLLAEDIESTKRRVNALENIVLPRLTSTVKYIKMRLDEMERENFFKLKRIKAVMES
ncbi:MAG: V-type ATP synthase subunit D [Candidatus Hydrothermarchaeaceae archaeon]